MFEFIFVWISKSDYDQVLKKFTLNQKPSLSSYRCSMLSRLSWVPLPPCSSSSNTKRTPSLPSCFHNYYALVFTLLHRPSLHMVPSLSCPKLFSWQDRKAIQLRHTSWYPSSYSQTGDQHNSSWTQSVVRCIRIRRLSGDTGFPANPPPFPLSSEMVGCN